MNLDRDKNWLIHDHREYDSLLEDCRAAAKISDRDAATRLFNVFAEEFKLHMLMEDEVLYPLLRKESGDPGRQLDLLAYEHEDIVRLIGDLSRSIPGRDFHPIEESLRELHRVLVQHNDHEEMVFLSLGTESLFMQREEIVSRLDTMNPRRHRKDWNF